MIRKHDILDRAAEWQLRPDVVEKDYVLGWMLAALGMHRPARDLWIFKGGTCVKKCYFETYRFSEDLDFTLQPDAAYDEASIRATLMELARAAGGLSGIEFPPDLIQIKSRRNQQGQDTFQGRVGYRGPLGVPTFPRVLFDITRHEPIMDPPAERLIFHPYPDPLPDALVLTYSFDELLAEKMRALIERSRPRDLYDVVFLLENASESFDLGRVRSIFTAKCVFKELVAPSAGELIHVVEAAPEMRSEWASMLGHQLPMLPPLDDLLTRLPALVQWLDTPLAIRPESGLVAVAAEAEETLVAPAGIRYWGGSQHLEAIRFAGANRLLIAFDYHGKPRTLEPYSLRRARTTGNLLLYGWEPAAARIKAFKVAEMINARSTPNSFQPRYRVEFTASGAVRIGEVVSSPRPRLGRARPTRRTGGPTYVFECGWCGKRFYHRKNDSRLRTHKAPNSSSDCGGRWVLWWTRVIDVRPSGAALRFLGDGRCEDPVGNTLRSALGSGVSRFSESAVEDDGERWGGKLDDTEHGRA